MTDNFVRREAVAEWNLPPAFNEEIGKITVRYAYFERSIQRSVWALAGVNDQIGQYAVRDPRVVDRIQMIRDLASLRSITLNETRMKAFLKLAEWAAKNRDLLCQGIWTRGEHDMWLVENLRGQHAKDEAVPHRNRRIAPGSVGYTVEELKKVSDMLDKLIAGALTLEGTIRRALRAASREKFE